MKKLISVFLLLVFLCKAAGIFGLFQFLRQDNYESVFSRSTDELQLVKLVIPKSKNISWEKSDEIIYDGKYYDVFTKSEDAQNFYLLCYSDNKDNQLTEAFQKHLSKENTDRKSANLMEQISFQCFEVKSCSWNFSLRLSERISIQSSAPLLPGFISVFSPPPDFLAC